MSGLNALAKKQYKPNPRILTSKETHATSNKSQKRTTFHDLPIRFNSSSWFKLEDGSNISQVPPKTYMLMYNYIPGMYNLKR